MEAVTRVNQPHVTFAFVDVGQGDSTVIILPERNNGIVVDCPANPATNDYLEDKGIETLHQVFITHSDEDHFGGVAELLDNFSGTVDQLIYNSYDHPNCSLSGSRRNVALRRLAAYIRRTGVDTQNFEVPHSWTVQGLHIQVLHPTNQDIKFYGPHGDSNNSSGILRFTYLDYKILLTADVGGKGWQDIFRRNTDLQAHVLKFPHHGAWYQPTNQQPSLEDVLDRINPLLAIFSIGSSNIYNHPHRYSVRSLSQRNIRTICTQSTIQCQSILRGRHNCGGTVEVRIDGNGMSVFPSDAGHQE